VRSFLLHAFPERFNLADLLGMVRSYVRYEAVDLPPVSFDIGSLDEVPGYLLVYLLRLTH